MAKNDTRATENKKKLELRKEILHVLQAKFGAALPYQATID